MALLIVVAIIFEISRVTILFDIPMNSSVVDSPLTTTSLSLIESLMFEIYIVY